MQQLEVKFSNKTLYMNIYDWKAQKGFLKERERVFLKSCKRLFLT